MKKYFRMLKFWRIVNGEIPRLAKGYMVARAASLPEGALAMVGEQGPTVPVPLNLVEMQAHWDDLDNEVQTILVLCVEKKHVQLITT
jgi:hypothetical protein